MDRLQIPMTPAPRSLASFDDSLLLSFAGFLSVERDPEIPIAHYFGEYDSWEKFSSDRTYTRNPFNRLHNGRMRTYQNYICIVRNKSRSASQHNLFSREEDAQGATNEYYIVQRRMHSMLEELEAYCPCFRCSVWAKMLSPLQNHWCATCTGCLKGGEGIARPEHIEVARSTKDRLEAEKQHRNKNEDEQTWQTKTSTLLVSQSIRQPFALLIAGTTIVAILSYIIF